MIGGVGLRGLSTADKSRRVIRLIECPERKGKTSLLVEWHVDRGKKVLQSIDCDNPQLMDYSG